MIYDEEVIGKCAIIEWEQYKKENINSFVLDDKMQIEQLEKVFSEINRFDHDVKIYVSTYPIEKNKNGIIMYSDMLWIKTKLSCVQLEAIFSNYCQIEPSSIFGLTEEEKNYSELYFDAKFKYKEFTMVSNLFSLDEIKVLYWD